MSSRFSSFSFSIPVDADLSNSISVLGVAGSGKTTFLSMLYYLLDPITPLFPWIPRLKLSLSFQRGGDKTFLWTYSQISRKEHAFSFPLVDTSASISSPYLFPGKFTETMAEAIQQSREYSIHIVLKYLARESETRRMINKLSFTHIWSFKFFAEELCNNRNYAFFPSESVSPVQLMFHKLHKESTHYIFLIDPHKEGQDQLFHCFLKAVLSNEYIQFNRKQSKIAFVLTKGDSVSDEFTSHLSVSLSRFTYDHVRRTRSVQLQKRLAPYLEEVKKAIETRVPRSYSLAQQLVKKEHLLSFISSVTQWKDYPVWFSSSPFYTIQQGFPTTSVLLPFIWMLDLFPQFPGPTSPDD